MDPKEFLRLAEELSKRTDDEAAKRTSVGRSYFALHHLTAGFMVDSGLIFSKDKSKHHKVIRNLKNCGIADIEEVGSSLSDLCDERNTADYELNLNKYQKSHQARLIFKKAQKAYDKFIQYTGKTKNKKTLQKNLRDYKKKINEL